MYVSLDAELLQNSLMLIQAGSLRENDDVILSDTLYTIYTGKIINLYYLFLLGIDIDQSY